MLYSPIFLWSSWSIMSLLRLKKKKSKLSILVHRVLRNGTKKKRASIHSSTVSTQPENVKNERDEGLEATQVKQDAAAYNAERKSQTTRMGASIQHGGPLRSPRETSSGDSLFSPFFFVSPLCRREQNIAGLARESSTEMGSSEATMRALNFREAARRFVSSPSRAKPPATK